MKKNNADKLLPIRKLMMMNKWNEMIIISHNRKESGKFLASNFQNIKIKENQSNVRLQQ